MTHLPELVIWPRPDSDNGETYPPLDGKSSKSPIEKAKHERIYKLSQAATSPVLNTLVESS